MLVTARKNEISGGGEDSHKPTGHARVRDEIGEAHCEKRMSFETEVPQIIQ